MATLSLGRAPKTFRKLVSVPLLDGTVGTIECVFKYRTLTEYGVLIDSITDDTKRAETSIAAIFERTREKNGSFLLQILEGWNLDVDFSLANAQQLCDELPGAAARIFEDYRSAIVEGRLGN